MENKVDKIMTHAAYLYVIIPFIIFCTGWFKWYYALFFAVILLLSYVFSVISTKQYNKFNLNKYKYKIILSILIISIVVLFSGIGEYSYQVEDQQTRNSILHDLVTHNWPYKINEVGNISPNKKPILIAYYIESWLPAALMGKVLGWNAANFVNYLWNTIGVILIFYFLCKYFNKFSIKILLLFLCFNSLYLIVSFFKYPFLSVITSDYQIWSNNMILAASGLESIYWIFNQTVTPWLIMLLILNNIPKQNIFFLYALCYLHGPFIFIGFFPFLVIIVIKDLLNKEDKLKTFKDRLLSYLTFQNFVAAPLIFLFSYFYLSCSPAVERLYIYHNINKYEYLLFIFISFGLISILIFNKYKKNPYYYAIIISLLILPLIGMGKFQSTTFTMRVSLAPQFMLMLIVTRYILEEGKSLIKRLVIVYVVLGAIDPVLQFGRSLVFTIGYYINPVVMNTYLYHRTSKWNDRINMLPLTNDMKNTNSLILNYNETIDRPLKIYDALPPQNENAIFIKYIMK